MKIKTMAVVVVLVLSAIASLWILNLDLAWMNARNDWGLIAGLLNILVLLFFWIRVGPKAFHYFEKLYKEQQNAKKVGSIPNPTAGRRGVGGMHEN